MERKNTSRHILRTVISSRKILRISSKVEAGKKGGQSFKKTINCRFEARPRTLNGPNSNGNGPRTKQNKVGNTNIALKEKKSTDGKITLKSEVLERKVVITLPIRTVSELNCSDHWRKKRERHKSQQKCVASVLNSVRTRIPVPCHIHLTRYAPRKLNKHDNLPASMKYIVDACCAIITGDFRPGRADDDERISISYDQVRCSQYGIKAEFIF